VTATDRGCPDAVTAEVLAVVGTWTVRAPVDTNAARDLGEVWFVYPFERAGPPRLLVRQSDDRRWTLPAGVDAVPFQIRAWSFLRYPAEAHKLDVPDVRCSVLVVADAAGFAENVRVEGCGAPFAEAARDAVAEWRFYPPVVDGEPIPSALTMSTTFVAAPPPSRGPAPGADRQQLWADQQFRSLTREERLWFIKAALLGEEPRDLGPGQVLVALPAPPDLGERQPPEFFGHGEYTGRPIPPLPDHPPVFVVGRKDHVSIEVYELPLPTPEVRPAGVERVACPMLVQVDAERRVFAWAEPGCDEAFRKVALETADRWLLRHLGPPGDTRVRFHAVLTVDAAGATVTIPADELVTPLEQLPDAVHTAMVAKPVSRFPPKIRQGTTLPDTPCQLTVRVTVGGASRDVTVVSCPAGFESAAVRAVKRWEWRPAAIDGVPIESIEPVTIRFAQ
jgi:hypothetical protein